MDTLWIGQNFGVMVSDHILGVSLTTLFGVLFVASEILANVSFIKSNSVFQAILSFIGRLKDGFKAATTTPPAQK